jgi:hypothetical protein
VSVDLDLLFPADWMLFFWLDLRLSHGSGCPVSVRLDLDVDRGLSEIISKLSPDAVGWGLRVLFWPGVVEALLVSFFSCLPCSVC